jgi:hypothetical protein
MYGQPTAIEAGTIWLALAIGLLVQAATIYGCIRLALIHHRTWVQAQDVKAERAAKRATESTIWGPPKD